MDFNVEDFGAVGDMDLTKAAANTVAFQAASAQAKTLGGNVYIPQWRGFPINNGAWSASAANMKIRGDSGMGCSDSPIWASRVYGVGPGHTLQVQGNGSLVEGLVFGNDGQQAGSDASLMITGGNVYCRDLYVDNPNFGISVSFPALAEGEFWLRDILIGGTVRTAAVNCNAGNAAVQMDHVLAYNSGAVQPPYGVVATSAGEFMMRGCDIDNCGTNLALVPGLGGAQNQHVNAVFLSDCLFDNGNGPGNCYIGPQGMGWVSEVMITNCWASTANNGNGAWNTNGFTFDGSHSAPPIGLNVFPIQGVTMVNCVSRSMVNHCGVYARAVNNLSVSGTKCSSNFAGIQLAPGCADYSIVGNQLGACGPAAVGSTMKGNAAYGLIVEPNGFGIIQGNMARGNGRGGFWNISPNVFQQISGNIWA